MRTWASELVKSNSNEYMMDEDNAVRNTSGESDVASSASFSSSGTVLDVDILFLYLPHVSILGQRRKRVGFLWNVMATVFVLLYLLSPTHVLFISHIILPSFLSSHMIILYCLSLFFCLSFPFLLAVSLSHAALFTVWKCPKLPATTYYKMHSSRAWISVWLWQPQCMLGKW